MTDRQTEGERTKIETPKYPTILAFRSNKSSIKNCYNLLSYLNTFMKLGCSKKKLLELFFKANIVSMSQGTVVLGVNTHLEYLLG